ncbi:uncharacterized protein LOC110727781 [Chenopodium quinoa]|nr:uncharacterized protein LOC110727781 [Chenopodium quinoa]
MNNVLLWTLKSIDVGDDEPSTQIPASLVPMTCTTNTEQHYASSYAPTAKAHGKAPIVSEPDFNADFNSNSATTFDEAFAEAMQFQEIRMTSQAFDTDCFDIPDQPPSKGIVISESPEPAAELPTWAKLSRPRSNAKNQKTISEDVDMETEDEDHVPRKKLRTALFKDNAGKDIAENKDSATSNLNDA